MSITNENDWKIIRANRKNSLKDKTRAWEVQEESESVEDLSDIDLNFDREGGS